MTEVLNNYNTLGNVILLKNKISEPFIKIDKKIMKSLSKTRYGRDAILVISGIFDYCRNPKHKSDSKAWNKKRVMSYFKDMHITEYAVNKIFAELENAGYLQYKKIYPQEGCNRIRHQYIFFESVNLNPDYNSKTENLLNDLETSLKDSKPIKKEEKKEKNKKKKDKDINLNYLERIEYNHNKHSAINLAKKIYDKSIFNILNTDNILFKINSESSLVLDYKNVISDIDMESLYKIDNEELAKIGFNIILKGIMKYKNSDIENNLKHSENLINKFNEYESSKLTIDALLRFRNYNRLFTKDLNKNLNDNTFINIKNIKLIYPDTKEDDYLYILDNTIENEITQNMLKNLYFLNFCYIIGSYLYYSNNIINKDKKLTYQDINKFANIFENYPYLIYLPIDDISMNLLDELYNN